MPDGKEEGSDTMVPSAVLECAQQSSTATILYPAFSRPVDKKKSMVAIITVSFTSHA